MRFVAFKSLFEIALNLKAIFAKCSLEPLTFPGTSGFAQAHGQLGVGPTAPGGPGTEGRLGNDLLAAGPPNRSSRQSKNPHDERR